MAIAPVQGNYSEESTTVTLNGVAAGNLIVLFAKWEGTTSGGITVSDGTSALEVGILNDPGTTMCGQFAWLLFANGGNKTYTVTFPSGASYQRLRVAEFSYTGTISLDVQNATGTGTSNAPQSGDITTTVAATVALGGYSENSTETPSSMQINDTAADGNAGGLYTQMWWKVFTSTLTNTHAQLSLTSSADWVCNIIAFKAAVATVVAPIFSGCSFIGSASSGHAIRITSPGTYNFSGNIFSGFGTDGGNSAAIFNDSSSSVIINVIGGGSIPTVKNGTGASTTVNNIRTLSMTGLVSGTEIHVYRTSDMYELAGIESSGTSWSWDYNADGTGIYITLIKPGYKWVRYSGLTLSTSGISIIATQQVDLGYNNPA